MADEKISQLPTVTNAAVGSASIFPIVDSNDSTTKSIALNQLDERWAPISLGLTTLGDTFYGGAGGTPTRLPGNTSATQEFLSQTGTGSGSAAPIWKALPGNSSALKSPTVQKFTSTGITTGYLFTISTSTTCAVGDTYTNNGNTYTVLGALSAQSGQVLFMSQASAPTASGTLTRATGSGTSSITFTAEVALGTYTTPTSPAPLYIKVRTVGGGGGGCGSGTASFAAGGTGGSTAFGINLILCAGGAGGATNQAGGLGGSATLGTGPMGIAIAGGNGNGSYINLISGSTDVNGGGGASSPFGGAAGGAGQSNTGPSAIANTGSGGAGGGAGSTAGVAGGAGGGAGGFVDALISSPAATYVYTVGAAGSLGGGGTSGINGGAGGSGLIIIEEFYQ